mmetsp:Transcript_5712/g.12049  ORF Transcript_5712/g.12049 Transcript_5712/m.12049 type:complete len:681 (-) Transcript_5712:2241-4283(-)
MTMISGCCSLPPFLTASVLSILLTEVAERFSYFGFRAVLVLYFHQALGYDESASVALFAFVSSTAYFTPVLGAVVADAYLGRYKTILWFGLAYFVGLAIMTFGAYLPGLEGVTDDDSASSNNDDVASSTSGAETTTTNLMLKKICTLIGLGLACVGTGGIKPCVSAFGADQVSSRGEESGVTAPQCDDRGEMIHMEVIAGNGTSAASSSADDPSTRESDNVRSFFSYFYFCINVGAVLSIFLVPIIRGMYGFGAAFLAPTLFLFFAITVFVSMRRQYVGKVRSAGNGDGDDGSLYTTFCVFLLLLIEQVRAMDILACCRSGRQHRQMKNVLGSGDQSVYVDQTGGSGAIEDNEAQQPQEEAEPAASTRKNTEESWKGNNLEQRFSRQQIHDATAVLHITPILAMLPVFWMLYDQQGSVWTLQATRMELNGLQPEQLNIVNPVEIMLLIPLFEKIIYPLLEARRWKITHLRRMAAGMVLTSLSFVVSGFLESRIQVREETGLAKVNVLWQIPQITILAVGEILVSVTGLEFSYASSPARIKAFLMGLYLLTTSIGDLMGGALYSSVFRRLDRALTMYICAGIMLVNFGVFVRVAIWWESDSKEGENDYASSMNRDARLISDGSTSRSDTCVRGLQTIDRRKSAMSSPSSSGDYVDIGDRQTNASREEDLQGVEMVTIPEIT